MNKRTLIEPDHLSHTQVRAYLTCGWRYYLRYVRGLIVPPSAAMTLGSAADHAANANYSQKMTTGEDLTITDLEEIFVENLKARREETIWMPDEGPGLINHVGNFCNAGDQTAGAVNHQNDFGNFDGYQQVESYTATVVWLIWSGTRNHPTATEHRAEGVAVTQKGQWIMFTAEGRQWRKNITSNGTRVERA